MLFRMLKKDLLGRKAIHFILFLFITLATIFLASSANNIIVVSSAVKHYIEYANVPDVNLVLNSDKEKKSIDAQLTAEKEKGNISEFAYNNLIVIADKKIEVKTEKKSRELDTKGASLYIGKMDSRFNTVYDEAGKSFTLKKGEIALSVNVMENNHLQIGDKIILNVQKGKQEFVIKEKVKDAAFGNEMVGMIRFMVSEEDYHLLEEENPKWGLYYIMTDDVTGLTQKINDQTYSSVMNIVTKDTYTMVYAFDMILSALLILVGICLIFIALLVLRFTLIFTMEEQYKEIGILKAVGLKDFSIKKIYLLRYLFLVLAGSLLGLCLSLPVSQFMVSGVSKNMIMESSTLNFFINIICAILVVVLVLLFCYLCTRKLKKVSAITAIHSGETGESFQNKRGISLSRRIHMPVPFYLGLNDIISHLRRYAVLIITFAISFVLITIPLNTLNTMKSTEMLYKFMLNPDSTIHVRKIEAKGENKYMYAKDLRRGMDRIQQELEEKGYKNVKVTSLPIYFIKYSSLEGEKKQNIMTIQPIGDEVNYAQYKEGEMPLLENEIAFSETVMKKNKWKIGDWVKGTVNEEEKTFLITGTYSDYMQLGNSARLSSTISTEDELMFDYWSVMVHMDTKEPAETLPATLKKQFKDYEWKTGQELVDQNVGGIQDTLNDLLFPMTLMLCLIIMLITLLMEKLFIVREKGETSMLKSIGFPYRRIRFWQITRMVLVALSSLILALPLSLLSNQFMLKPVFALMGADVSIQIDLWDVYFIYPGVLFLGIVLATVLATRDIKKIDIRECNNIE